MTVVPELHPAMVSLRSRVYADRYHMIQKLWPFNAKPETVAEVGVAFGDFSEFLIDNLKPSKFFAIDTFVLHQLTDCMGIDPHERLGTETHLDWYQKRFPQAITLEGTSQSGLARLPEPVDLVYLDAGHTYDDVHRDLIIAVEKLTPGGLLIGNDYTPYDVRGDGTIGGPYGVIRAFNELLVSGGWEVIGFALNQYGFHDIALQRSNR